MMKIYFLYFSFYIVSILFYIFNISVLMNLVIAVVRSRGVVKTMLQRELQGIACWPIPCSMDIVAVERQPAKPHIYKFIILLF